MAKKKLELIPNFKPFIPKESIDNVIKTLKTAWIGGDGPRVKQFEGESADPLRGMFENLISLEDRIVGVFTQKTVETSRILITE